MSDKGTQNDTPPAGEPSGTAVATPKSKTSSKKKPTPAKPPQDVLPPWKVLLHNDEKNEQLFVIRTIVELTPLDRETAYARMIEAHKSGVALLLMTHKERAELYVDQFQSMGLTVSIEPDK
jgi:ATP-dependent Clp protease adaptor protein ClpS